MKFGGILLIDEISLAQDSVLERLNSVLEREKTIVISEKGDGSVEVITAHQNFKIIATMNPSGDYGKRELTPALRNRFTEIWVEPVTGVHVLEENIDQINRISNLDYIDFEALELKGGIKNDFMNFVLKEALQIDSSILHSETSLSLAQSRGIVVLILHKIVYTFNKRFGEFLKPLTVRDIKSSFKFILHSIKAYGKITLVAFREYIEMLLGGFK